MNLDKRKEVTVYKEGWESIEKISQEYASTVFTCYHLWISFPQKITGVPYSQSVILTRGTIASSAAKALPC